MPTLETLDHYALPPPQMMQEAGRLGIPGIPLDDGRYILFDVSPTVSTWLPSHAAYQLRYYRWTLQGIIASLAELNSVARSRCILLWDAERTRFNSFVPVQPCTTTKEKFRTMIKAIKTALVTAYDAIVKGLRNTYKGSDGKTRTIGYMALTVANMLGLLTLNTNNRHVRWAHIETLIENWRTDWIVETTKFVVDSLNRLADGQHRIISFILAYGSKDEVAECLRNLHANRERTLVELSEKQIELLDTDPFAVVQQFISAYTPHDGSALAAHLDYVAVEFGANPRTQDKCDADQSKRTGADKLGQTPSASAKMAQYGIKPQEMQGILRALFCRCLPPTVKAEGEGSTYGSLKKGGNVHPDRYPHLWDVFGKYVCEALDIIHGEGAKWNWSVAGIPHIHLVGNIALALQGGIERTQIVKYLTAHAPAKYDTDAQGKVTCEPLDKAKTATVVDRIPNVYDRVYAHARYMQMANPNPDIQGTPTQQLDKVLSVLGDNPEQSTECRLPGWDTQSPACKAILTDAWKKKRKVEERLAKAAKAAK